MKCNRPHQRIIYNQPGMKLTAYDNGHNSPTNKYIGVRKTKICMVFYTWWSKFIFNNQVSKQVNGSFEVFMINGMPTICWGNNVDIIELTTTMLDWQYGRNKWIWYSLKVGITIGWTNLIICSSCSCFPICNLEQSGVKNDKILFFCSCLKQWTCTDKVS